MTPSRDEVVTRLKEHVMGRELASLAQTYGVTVNTPRGINKGWAGQTLEYAALLPASNAALPDGGDFELKSTKVEWLDEQWSPKETIKITNLNPQKILEEEFETSVLWSKLSRLILVGCHYEAQDQAKAVVVCPFDVTAPELVKEIRSFWEDVRHLVASGEMMAHHNVGSFSDILQLRPTGTGKGLSVCPITGEKFPARAFYATKRFLKQILSASR